MKRNKSGLRKGRNNPSGPIVMRVCDFCHARTERATQDAVSVRCGMCVQEMLAPDDEAIREIAGPATTVRK
jgi:hypothetical protein